MNMGGDSIHSVNIAAIEAAAQRLAGHAVQALLIESAALNERVGGRVLIKPECLQLSGSFKCRGAFNRLAQLTEAERRAGVVAWSSGNHAQGVADAARRLGFRATIVMPADAPAVKTANTRAGRRCWASSPFPSTSAFWPASSRRPGAGHRRGSVGRQCRPGAFC